MSILQSILFFLSLGLLIVGAHQTFTVGFYESYWLFMLSLVLLFIYGALKKNNKDSATENKNKPSKAGKAKKKKSSRNKK